MDRLLKPEQAAARGVLTPAQVSQWRSAGWCLVDGLLDAALVEAAFVEAKRVLLAKGASDFGSNGMLEFPTENEAVNALSLHEDFIKPAQQLLGQEVVLSQADIWLKVGQPSQGEYHHSDQRVHMDFPNHTLLHPPAWDNPEAVAMIVYFSDAEECGGRTAVIPRNGEDDPHYTWPYSNMPGFGAVPWKNDRESVESMLREKHPEMAAFRQKLYDSECYVDFKPGTVLFYRHDLWHRGTPLVPGKQRIVQNLTFKTQHCDWLTRWNPGWARMMYTRQQVVERMVAGSSMLQRQVLGFPAPGAPYWTEQTIDAVHARYGPFGFDVTPYREALARRATFTA